MSALIPSYSLVNSDNFSIMTLAQEHNFSITIMTLAQEHNFSITIMTLAQEHNFSIIIMTLAQEHNFSIMTLAQEHNFPFCRSFAWNLIHSFSYKYHIKFILLFHKGLSLTPAFPQPVI